MSFKQQEIAEYIRLLLDRTKDLDEQVEVLQLMEGAKGDAVPPFGGGHTALQGVFGVPVEVISYTSSTGFMGARQAPVSTTKLAEDPNLKEIPVEAFNGIDTVPVIGKTVIAEFIGTTGGAAAAVYGFFGETGSFYLSDGSAALETVTLGQTITFVTGTQDGVSGLVCNVGPTRKVTYEHANTSDQPTLAETPNRLISAVALDTYGHVTSLTLKKNEPITLYDELGGAAQEVYHGETITFVTTTSTEGTEGLAASVGPTRKVTYRHANTSEAPTVVGSDGSNRFVSGVALDAYGHVTSLTLTTSAGPPDEKVALATGLEPTYLESLLNNKGTYVAADDIPIKWQRIDGAITFFIDASTDTTTGCT